MTRSFFNTFRTGLLVSAGGLGLVLIALLTIVRRPADADLAVRLQVCAAVGVTGCLVTAVGFGLMNVGALRSGEAYASIDPATFADDADHLVSENARSEIVAATMEPGDSATTPRCLACAAENRASARFCDQCGERL